MKKILLVAAMAVATLSANAQYYVGGTASFNSTKTPAVGSETKTTRFNIAPEVGCSLTDKWGIGLALSFGSNTNKTETTTGGVTTSVETTVSNLGLKPYARYQALQWGKANIFVDGGLNFEMISQKDMKNGTTFGLFVTPGVAFNVTNHLSIVGKLNNIFAFNFITSPVADVAGAPDAPTAINAGLSTSGFNVGALSFGVFYNF